MSGIKVNIKNGNIEKALKIFKKKIKDSHLMLEIRDRQEYTKPSLKKRQLKNKAINRNKHLVLEEKRRNEKV